MRTDAALLEVLRPTTLAEALSMLRDAGPLVPLAGGTDLLVVANAGTLPKSARRFVDLWPLDELRGVAFDRRTRTFTFGALTTFTDCLRDRAVRAHLPILAQAAREVGGPQIQNRGTLGGNIGNASPAADSLPVLAACDTTLVLASASGEREVPLDGYFTGYRASVRRDDELIAKIRVTVPDGKQVFRKVGTRAAQAISKVVMAAVGPRVAFGSVAPTVVRARSLEQYLDGGGRDLDEARRHLGQDIRPIDDIRSTARYRMRVAENLLALVV